MQRYNTLIETPKKTPQSQPLAGRGQVANSAGGYVWSVDDQKQLDRFLILGSSGGTYYVGAKDLTKLNVDAVKRALAHDGPGTVARIVEISVAGRAVSNDPALVALALAAASDDLATRQAAFGALPQVARIPTHLFHFIAYLKPLRGWGRAVRSAVQDWYKGKTDLELVYSMTKYQARDGWAHGDLLRLAHIKPTTDAQHTLFKYALDKLEDEKEVA